MEIRRKVFSLFQDENGEERYFSTTEFEYIDETEQREFSEKKDKEKKSTLNKVGKAALIGGGTAALAGGVAENVIASKIARKAADKYGVDKLGAGLATKFVGIGKKTSKEVSEITTNAIRTNKKFRGAKKADLIGSGLALAGAGMLVADKIRRKKESKKEKED